MKKIISISLLLIGSFLIAQTKQYMSYDWEKSPTPTKQVEKYKSFDYYVVKDKHILEYAYDSNNELSLFDTKHIITHINNDKGVETKNKMYISTGRIIEMIDLSSITTKDFSMEISIIKHSRELPL